MVIALGILLCEVFGKHVMACRGESVASHSTIVFILISGLSKRGQSHYHVTGFDVGIVNNI